jgi:hypothetical protein
MSTEGVISSDEECYTEWTGHAFVLVSVGTFPEGEG